MSETFKPIPERPKDFDDLSPRERAAWKVAHFGDNALLDNNELAAVLDFSVSTLERQAFPCADFGERTKRYHYGTVMQTIKQRMAA